MTDTSVTQDAMRDEATAELMELWAHYAQRFPPDSRAGRQLQAAQQLVQALVAIDTENVLACHDEWRIGAVLVNHGVHGTASCGTLLQLDVLAHAPEVVTLLVQRLQAELQAAV